MPCPDVMSAPIPARSVLASLCPSADLADAYSIELPRGASRNPRLLADAVLGGHSRRTNPLMIIRDGLVAPFGLKTSRAIAEEAGAAGRDTIGYFPVLGTYRDEIVLGDDDRHLDFRMSIFVDDAAGAGELVWISVVHCHGRAGRAYLAAVRPFHRRVIAWSLGAAAKRGWPGAQTSRDGSAADAP